MTTEVADRGPLLLIAAAAAAAAGLIHAAAVGTHTDMGAMGRVFAVAAAVQLGWAVLVVVHPTRWRLVSGAAINAAMVLAWTASRTVGWPVVESMSQPLPVGFQDLVAATLGVVAVLAAIVAWLGLAMPTWLRAAPASALATVIVLGVAVPALATPVNGSGGEVSAHADHAHADDAHDDDAHDHHAPADHSHDDAHEHAHAHEHDHGATGPAGTAYDHDDPVISLDDPRLSENQRAAAQALIDDVAAEMERFTDIASVEAEGYVSIGDGITGFEHFSHPVLREDPITMDPRRPESIVFRVNPDGSRDLVSAMFIMPPGSTMDDVPDIAGTLTTWHDHQDLCWLENRVVGLVSPDGSCAFGEFRVGQPMLHVWLEPHPCGPFAGLEGHGGDCRQHAH